MRRRKPASPYNPYQHGGRVEIEPRLWVCFWEKTDDDGEVEKVAAQVRYANGNDMLSAETVYAPPGAYEEAHAKCLEVNAAVIAAY
jgi:hypothetical protein